jgi:uncharacterized protein YceH (UPF0502 family)
VELSAAQGRVLGALVEKERTTPQGYPLTDNALVAACNQTTSRDPVVAYDLATVRVAVRELREVGVLRTVHRTGERSDKHRHELEQGLGLSPAQVALLAVLLLRGPQTLAELRSRSERLQAFASVDEVERELAAMADRAEPLVGLLPRQPGRKEARFGQLLAAAEAGSATPSTPPVGGDGRVDRGEFGRADAGREASVGDGGGSDGGGVVRSGGTVPEGLTAVVADLVEQVATLRREVEELRAALERATGG